MDKNLIDIDSLFRQRLGGAEEREREGAWMRMSQLLDEEDRRKPAGFYWRRTFSYLGVALLLASLTVGGYKYNAFRSLPTGSATSGELADNGMHHSSLGNIVGGQSTDASQPNGAASGNGQSAVSNSSHSSSDNKNKPSDNDINTTPSSTTNGSNGLAAGSTIGVYNGNKNDRPTAGSHVAGSGRSHTAIEPAALTHATASTEKISRDEVKFAKLENGKLTMASKTETADAPAASNYNSSVALTTTLPSISATPKNNAAGNGHPSAPGKKGNSHISSAIKNNTVNNNIDKGPATTAVNKKDKHTGAKTTASVVSTTGHMPSTATADNVTKPHTSGTPVAYGSGAPTHIANAAHVTRTTAGKKPSAHTTEPTAKEKEVAVAAAPAPRQTKTIQRIVLQQRLVNSGTSEPRQMKLDTLSADVIIQDVMETSERETGHISALRTLAPATAAANPVPSAKSNVSNSVASLNASPAMPMDNLQAAAANKKSGLTAIEKVSERFNDVKFKMQGITFSPGLTVGINSTFFGPNNFKGFQFGFTGTFVVDEEWSLMAEVKYFNRMNNNFAITDKYVDYNRNDSVTNTYSFSTLHSFELPVSFRYTVNRFSFYAGFNVAYALGINTGPDPIATNLVNTPAPGLRSAPMLSSHDFDSRIGIGYLFGMNFQVSDNMSIDFRSTQGLWDNKKGEGGKYISGQLYKSPSFQFSIGYRFGGKKVKE